MHWLDPGVCFNSQNFDALQSLSLNLLQAGDGDIRGVTTEGGIMPVLSCLHQYFFGLCVCAMLNF